MRFRSKFEAEVALMLGNRKIDFEFEPENVFPGDRVNVTLRP